MENRILLTVLLNVRQHIRKTEQAVENNLLYCKQRFSFCCIHAKVREITNDNELHGVSAIADRIENIRLDT